MTIGVCTDSSAQLPPELVERFHVAVVPITVRVDECEYMEGVDLGADAFYARFSDGHSPVVTTSQPSPGQFALAYDELAERGCAQILSIHSSAAASGTINAARLGAHNAPVPVRLVDSGTASFGVSCCVWAAAEAIAAGASLEDASAVAEHLAPSIGNVFIVDALDRVGVGGRRESAVTPGDAEGIPVLALQQGQIDEIDRVATIVDAVNAMSARAVRWGERLRVAIGTADRAATPVAVALADAIGEAASVLEVVHYRIGPSIGARIGPGAVSCFMFSMP